MIVLENSQQNLSEYIQFLFKKIFELNKKGIISGEKMRNSGNYNYDYLTRSSERIFNPCRYSGYSYT